MLSFRLEPLAEIVPLLRAELQSRGEAQLLVPDPDLGLGLYAGEVTAAGIHRPLTVWSDLADALEAHLLLPERAGAGQIKLHFRRYATQPAPDAAGYGPDSEWSRVNKLEDPIFLLTLTESLQRVAPPDGGRVLALGVNTGRELQALALAFPGRRFEVVGVDLDASPLAVAAASYPAGTFVQASFVQADVNALPAGLGHLGEPPYDLILALSLLQSPGVVQDRLLKTLRGLLTPGGGLVLGYPNARYRDGFLSYGARMRNYARPDFSLLMSDVTDARRRLQKYGFKVYITGKYEVLLTAVPAGRG